MSGTQSQPPVSCHSMYEPLRRVLLRHPAKAFVSQRHLDENWKRFNFTDVPDFGAACRDYDRFVDILTSTGAEAVFFDSSEELGLDSIYVHDPLLVLGESVVQARMGKEQRSAETGALANFARLRGWRLSDGVRDPGTLEGGDVTWIGDRTIAVGVGYRTNLAGVAQLRQMTEEIADTVIPVPLPHFRGPDDVLHLMSLISPVGEDVAVIYRPLLPVPFLQGLEAAGFRLLDVPEDEFDTLGCNVLSLAPETVLMADGNPKTRSALEAAGIHVLVYPPTEISLKGQGGPTCLTRPLVRKRDQTRMQRDA